LKGVSTKKVLKTSHMENSKKLEIKFINGEFTPEDAKELLLNVIAKKMQFQMRPRTTDPKND
jgi:hypothetical protein